jgi:dolichyl-phosphate beta-glucosyltransferase
VRRRLRRFAAIGLVATLVDIGVLLGLTRRRGWAVGPADLAAIVAAAGVSYSLNRAITFGDDPTVRWVDHPSSFVVSASVAGAVDVAALSAIVAARGSVGSRDLLAAKLPALAAAAAVRQAAYRWVLFSEVRETLRERRQLAPAPGELRLSMVVPAFHEEPRIGITVARIRAELSKIDQAGGLEIVVVDDGSSDRTADAAREAGADQVVVLPRNRGKGAAVRAGMLAARGRSVVFTDADLAYAPRQVVRVLEELESGWDVVVGSRKHTDTNTLVRAGRLREIGGRGINLLTHAVLLGQYRDTQCGLKGFRSDVARLVFSHTRIDGFAFDVEVFHLVERYRLSLAEVPVEVENSEQSTVRVVRDALTLLRDLGRVLRGGRRGWYDLSP